MEGAGAGAGQGDTCHLGRLREEGSGPAISEVRKVICRG